MISVFFSTAIEYTLFLLLKQKSVFGIVQNSVMSKFKCRNSNISMNLCYLLPIKINSTW